MPPSSKFCSTKVMRFSSTFGWWMLAHSPTVDDAFGPGTQVAGVLPWSQPAQYRFHAGSGVPLSRTTVLSEHTAPFVQSVLLNGLRVRARKVEPLLVVVGFGSAL